MRRSCKFLPLLFVTMIEFFGNNCFSVSSVSNKCLCLLIISLTFGSRGWNSVKNITEVVFMVRFFFFFATERDAFSNLDFAVFGLCFLENKINKIK